MGNYKRLYNLIDKCKNCKFSRCEQCEINWLDVQNLAKLLEENKILRQIISSVREETRLIRFSKGAPYNTPKKEIFYKFINIQKLLKGNYPFLSTEKFIDDLLRGDTNALDR